MAILIEGMEIPKNCYTCPFCDYVSARCDAIRGTPYTPEDRYDKRADWCPLRPASEWIPVESRPMTEEERKDFSERIGYDIEYEEAVMYVSSLPEDGQQVLILFRDGRIENDEFYNDPDYGCYFIENGDMDGVVAWMPLPEPPKEDEEE